MSAANSRWVYAAPPDRAPRTRPLPRPSNVRTRCRRASVGTCGFQKSAGRIDHVGNSAIVASPVAVHLPAQAHAVALGVAGGVRLPGFHRRSSTLTNDHADATKAGADRQGVAVEPEQQQRLAPDEGVADERGDLGRRERTEPAEALGRLGGHLGEQLVPPGEQARARRRRSRGSTTRRRSSPAARERTRTRCRPRGSRTPARSGATAARPARTSRPVGPGGDGSPTRAAASTMPPLEPKW